MANVLLWMTVSFVFIRACIQAEVTFQNCGTPSDHVAELDLEKDSETDLTCIGIGAEKDVRWALDRNKNLLPAGICRPPSDGSDCDNYLAGIMTPSRTFASESTMRIHHIGEYRRHLVNATLICGEEERRGWWRYSAKCPIDLIKPADGTCKAEVDTTSDAWRVHVHCDVTSGNSTRNRYNCILRQNRNEIKKMKMTQNTLPEGSAVCDIWVRLNTSVIGGHSYEVQFIPGRKVVRVEGDITIERPNEPEITNCRPEGMVRENQTLTCDCRTDRTGKPEGHLRWSVKVAEKEKTFHILKDGEKGGKSLPLTTRPLTRSNHTNKLSCGVQWGNEFIRDSYSHEVQTSVLEVKETQSTNVTFRCTADFARPSPSLVLVCTEFMCSWPGLFHGMEQ
ncbi:hypothetical protein ACOMHN_036208 [Nucella lapillus]